MAEDRGTGRGQVGAGEPYLSSSFIFIGVILSEGLEIWFKAKVLQIHTATHIQTLKCKCKNCDFDTNCVDSIEVHVGDCRKPNFECGLCGQEFKLIENLEMHLQTCWISKFILLPEGCGHKWNEKAY